VVLYEFLTGANPFYAPQAAQVFYRLTTEEPLPLSSCLPDVPERLEGVMRRLLSKNRAKRYQSMEDARFDLQPVLLEMRQAQIQGLIGSAEGLIRDRRLDEADGIVRRVLDLDQSNAWARKWRGELREMLRVQSMRVRVRQLVEKADAENLNGDETEADKLLREALNLDPANDDIRHRIDEIQAKRARAERAARLVANAREELNRRALTRALENASLAAETDPKNLEARQLVSEIHHAMEQRDLDTLRKNALSSVTRLVLLQAYDEAIDVLNQFAGQVPGDPAIEARLEEVKRLHAAHLARQEFERAIAEGQDLLRRGKYSQAVGLLRPCAKRAPENTEIARLLAYAVEQMEVEARAAQVQQILAQGEACAARGEIDRALDLAGQAQEMAPDNERAQQLRDAMMEARRRREEDLEVKRLVAKGRSSLDSGTLDEATVLAAELANRFPGNSVVLEFQKEVERRIEERRKDSEREMRDLATRVEQLLAAGRGDEATVILQSLTVRYPAQQQNFAPLIARAANIEQETRERQQVEAELAQFRDLMKMGRSDEALAAVERGLLRRPNHPQLVEERNRARRRVAAAQAERDIELNLSLGKLDEAIGLAESARSQFPEDERIAGLLAAAREQRALSEGANRVAGLLQRNEIDKANTLIADLLRRDSANIDLQRLKRDVDRLLRRRETFAAAEQCRKRLEFKKARELAEQLVRDDADDGAARDLLEAIGRQQVEHDRALRISAGKTEANKFLNSRKFDAAYDCLIALAREFPDSADIQDELRRVQEVRQEQDKRDIYARGRAEAEALMKRRLEDGIAKLQSLLQSFPDDLFLQQDLKAAQETKALRDRAAIIETEVRELEALFRKGDAQGVKDRASQLLQSYEEPRARELLGWANKTLSEVRGIRREIDGSTRRWLWISGITVALALAVAIYMKNRPVTVEFRVQPREITFAYQLGGPLPKPNAIQIDGTPSDKVWIVAASDPWFTVNPTEVTGGGSIRVEIDPSHLAPGEYSGFANVSAKEASLPPASVRIRLQVTPKPPPPPAPSPKEEEVQVPPKIKSSGPEKGPKVSKEKKQATGATAPVPIGNSGNTQPTGNPVTIPQGTTGAQEPAGPVTAPPEPAVDCHAPDYGGLPGGNLRWAGSLGPGESVTITRRNTIAAGPGGRVTGDKLPGCDVSVRATGGVQIAEPPVPGNRFGHIILKNPTSAPIASFTIYWTVR
jgi:hypothetical protein